MYGELKTQVFLFETAGKLFLHRLVAHEGDVADHAGERQAVFRLAGVVIAALAPGRIGHDGLPDDLVEGDLLRRMLERRGDRYRGKNAVRISRGPLQGLHAAH